MPDRAALARQAATRFVAIAREAIELRGRFAVALSGGSTPLELYSLLATPEFVLQIDWPRTHLFWGDERAVPPDHPECNYRMTNEALLSKIPVPAQNVHRIHAELPPDDAAREYENDLREFFYLDADKRRQTQNNVMLSAAKHPAHSNENHLAQRTSETLRSAQGDLPSFDLILLGLGADGHTASLFPHTRVLRETQRWVAAEYVEKLGTPRITLTAPVINAARHILFLVAGADKAETVRAVLRGAYRPDDLPAQLVQPTNGKVVWLMDEGASEKLKVKSTVC